MIGHMRFAILICLVVARAALPAAAQDMRAAHARAAADREALLEKAAGFRQAAEEEARNQALAIARDKDALSKAVSGLKREIQTLETRNAGIQRALEKLKAEAAGLQRELAETAAVNREFEGAARTHAKDLAALVKASLLSGQTPGREDFLEDLSMARRFPTMADAARMADLLFEEIRASGEVALTRGPIVDRKGREQEATLLLLGKFTGIYDLGGEVGFLLFSEASQRYFALSRLPSARVRDNIRDYLAGKSQSVFLDVSKGGAIRQLAHQLSLAEQVPKGGALVWPILGILAVSLAILIERVLFFVRRRVNAEKLMGELRGKIAARDWAGCDHLLSGQQNRFIPKVLGTALALRDGTRSDMENALQEAILGEIPAIERFLSTLGMLAAIAPLMGLLGTVTGMINTFHVITCYGTGDPRMMSGGISEALVTTMLGLCVAIPIMLAHTLLSRQVETQISGMEEKSVAFVNMIFKTRSQEG